MCGEKMKLFSKRMENTLIANVRELLIKTNTDRSQVAGTRYFYRCRNTSKSWHTATLTIFVQHKTYFTFLEKCSIHLV